MLVADKSLQQREYDLQVLLFSFIQHQQFVLHAVTDLVQHSIALIVTHGCNFFIPTCRHLEDNEKVQAVCHKLIKKEYNSSLARAVQLITRKQEEQGQTVHKLQIATFWEIYLYISQQPYLYIYIYIQCNMIPAAARQPPRL